jgi:hypothetical protein
MKRQFDLVKGKTELHWEIEREGAVVTSRSWGRNRKEYVVTKRHSSETAAKRSVEERIEFQLSRGFTEVGPGAKKAKPRLIPEGPDAVAAAKKAIVATTIPALRALGFRGTFPNFCLFQADRHSVVKFMWGRSQGWLTVLLGVVPPRANSTPAQEVRRALNIRNRQRVSIRDLIPHSEGVMLFFDEAAKKAGAKWPEYVAAALKNALETKGMAWLEAPERRPGRS